MSDLSKLAIDVFHDNLKGKYSANDKKTAEEAIRLALIDANGGSEKIDRKSFRRNKVALFEAIEEILGTLVVEGIEEQFAPFVEIRNLAFGDTEFFMVDDYRLFPVATVSGGNGNIERQRLDRNAFQVQTKWRAVKIYEELERFLAGRVDWAKMVNKIQRSFNAQIAADVYGAIQTAYNALTAPYLFNGSADRTQLNTLVEHVRSATDREVQVYGTLLALQQFAPQYIAYAGQMVDQRNELGFFPVIDGIEFVRIKQAHTPGTDNFAVGNNFLLVVPQGEEKLVKLVIEGGPMVEETTNRTMNADRTIEYEFGEKYGVGVVTATKYGAYVTP